MQVNQEFLQLLQQHGFADSQLAASSTAADGAEQQQPGLDGPAPALLPLLQRWAHASRQQTTPAFHCTPMYVHAEHHHHHHHVTH
jgi:hypothetical protein